MSQYSAVKRTLVLLTASALLILCGISLFPRYVSAQSSLSVGSAEELIEAVAAAPAHTPVVLSLNADIVLQQTVVIPNGRQITLVDDGTPRVVTAATSLHPMLQVEAGGSLTIRTSAPDDALLTLDASALKGQYIRQGGVVDCAGTFSLEGGTIANMHLTGISSGVVRVWGDGARMDMRGGTIQNNVLDTSALSSDSASLLVGPGATLSITGGAITRNATTGTQEKQRNVTGGLLARANASGGVTVQMTGGEISHNQADYPGAGGGGVLLLSPNWTDGYHAHTASMTLGGDAKIIHNTATYAGGGVFVYGQAELTVNGGLIAENTVTDGFGGGVATYDFFKDTGQPDSYMPTWNQFVQTRLTVNGGQIVRNHAQSEHAVGDAGCGGGVYVASNDVSLHGGRIEQNTAERQGGGVYVGSTPYVVRLYDALVTANHADLIGGGLWLCPTGAAASAVENGGAIFANTAGGAGDDVASLPKTNDATLSLTNRLLGNYLVHWFEDGALLPDSSILGNADPDAARYAPGQSAQVGGVITEHNGPLVLKAIASEQGRQVAEQHARLFIRDNTAPRGGGIGTNGMVLFNRKPVVYPTIDIRVRKNWAGDAQKLALRPPSVTVHLYQDGQRIDTAVLSADNQWSASFPDLPQYQHNALEQDVDKTACVYTVEEEPVQGYQTHLQQDASPGLYVFTLTNTLQQFGALAVEKTVDILSGDAPQAFAFTVACDDPSLNGAYGDLSFTDGVASFSLRPGERITATGLPAGLSYRVEEAPCQGYTPVVLTENAQGVIQPDQTVVVSFQNRKIIPDIPQTGETPPFASICLIAGGLLLLGVCMRLPLRSRRPD